jgi:hypothetical protein
MQAREAVGLECVDGKRAELIRHLEADRLDMLGAFKLVTLEMGAKVGDAFAPLISRVAQAQGFGDLAPPGRSMGTTYILILDS